MQIEKYTPSDSFEYTEAMKGREITTRQKWNMHESGYGYIIGKFMAHTVCYICLPPNHPDIGKNYFDFDVEVNGGLTFGEENVFGWDYNHYMNSFDYSTHIENALRYFTERGDMKLIPVKVDANPVPPSPSHPLEGN